MTLIVTFSRNPDLEGCAITAYLALQGVAVTEHKYLHQDVRCVSCPSLLAYPHDAKTSWYSVGTNHTTITAPASIGGSAGDTWISRDTDEYTYYSACLNEEQLTALLEELELCLLTHRVRMDAPVQLTLSTNHLDY